MRNKRQTIIAPFFAILIYFMFIPDLFATQEHRTIEELEKAELPSAAEIAIRPRIEYTSDRLKDPFQSNLKKEITIVTASVEEAAVLPLPALTIQGVIWGGSSPCAIINNKVVRIGDTIEGARITEIKKEGITVLFNGGVHNLSAPAATVNPKKAEGG